MRTLIISDLHLGNGGPYDVFEGGEALPALLDKMSGESPLRVLVNGDGVDFLMNEDALELDETRAVAQAHGIVGNPASAGVLAAFGRVLARGGEVTIRLGNHDVELAFPAVQAAFRRALGQPAEVAAKLAIVPGEEPEILEIGGARVLVTHGEQNDKWNKVDYEKLLAGDKRYKYAPGSTLVKKILNPGTGQQRMRFLSLLKPDFQGAALTALAVDPMVAKQLFKGATLSLIVQLFQRKGMATTFQEGETIEDRAEAIPFYEEDSAPPATDEVGLSEGALGDRMDVAGLDEEEQEAIKSMLGENFIGPFDEDDGVLRRASVKIAKAALSLYARFQRRVTGKEGDEYFVLEPMADEWAEAQRLAKKFKTGAVIIGHTHAARWKDEGGLLYANTGTWIGLMQLPRSEASDEEWTAYLHELRQNKELKPEAQKLAKVFTRFTAVLAEEHPEGGAALSLVEWVGGALKTLGSSRVATAAAK